ncbi:Transmembrane protein 220 [Labeo rohita]|uniref:Transmembrane protein 220 n=1 Tax=Labeo rohita TaxID=84645 RepID=A0ABQ8MX70_LABRO|nr:Transmembrane protein 220 [Labeo rohita]
MSVSFSQIIWRVCYLFMSVFFSLATYVQVGFAIPAGLCSFALLSTTNNRDYGRIYLCHNLFQSHCYGGEWLICMCFVASTFGVILGWKLYKEGITDIFQQEEGR